MQSRRIIEFIQKYGRELTVFSICVYAMYLRLVKLAHHTLWEDEKWQLDCMQGSFRAMLTMLPKREVFPYLSGDYYLIFPFFKIFSYNKWGLAIPHILATILGLIFLYLLSKQYFKTFLGYIVTFSIVCLNATLINHATEIRVYAVLPTLALMALYFSQKIVDQNVRMDIRIKCAIGIFFVVVIWFHAYGIAVFFLPLAYSVINTLMDRKKSEQSLVILKDILKFVAVILCIAMPLWLYSFLGPNLTLTTSAGDKSMMGEGIYYIGGGTFRFIPNPIENMTGFLKAVFGNLVGNKKFYFLLGGIALAALAPYKGKLQQMFFVMITVFIPIGLILWMDLRANYWFLQRQFSWVMPFFAIFVGWIWDALLIYARAYNKKTLRNGADERTRID
ncbi:MAG: hypothetical protein JW847_09880 [Candidatus Omnitrophica bacterium]|nr:hypothetical protein [Candidatus Omnitrophota bacterium]